MRDTNVLTRTSSTTISMPMIENLFFMKAHVKITTDDLIDSRIDPIGSMISTNDF